MMGEIFALRRLRWKLTLSYTLVAAVTLLALELILAGALVAFLNSPLLPRLVVQNFRDEVAPRLERPLNQNPPDTEAIRERLVGRQAPAREPEQLRGGPGRSPRGRRQTPPAGLRP
jgi:two-component system, NarL family, sensor histidine kinase LiaS